MDHAVDMMYFESAARIQESTARLVDEVLRSIWNRLSSRENAGALISLEF